MAGACVLSDAQSLSLGGGDAAGELGGGHEMAVGGVHQALQHPAPAVRAFICRTLQGLAGGWQRQRLFENGV